MQSSLQQENSMLKQQLEATVQENSLLKRAVVTQQKRQRETEDQSQELQGLRQMVSQYQEQLRTLEVNNYALTLHLKQALQNNSSIPGRFHPDVF
ncbi:BnaA07g07960D [Brassica napus]|nr:BnaA07g07960D [Brassica napus]